VTKKYTQVEALQGKNKKNDQEIKKKLGWEGLFFLSASNAYCKSETKEQAYTKLFFYFLIIIQASC